MIHHLSNSAKTFLIEHELIKTKSSINKNTRLKYSKLKLLNEEKNISRKMQNSTDFEYRTVRSTAKYKGGQKNKTNSRFLIWNLLNTKDGVLSTKENEKVHTFFRQTLNEFF